MYKRQNNELGESGKSDEILSSLLVNLLEMTQIDGHHRVDKVAKAMNLAKLTLNLMKFCLQSCGQIMFSSSLQIF